MAFKFYIDGVLVDQPVNDTDLETSIKRNALFSSLLITQDAEVQWNGNNDLSTGVISGYTYLTNLFDDSTCQEANLVIRDQVDSITSELLYTGVIKMSNCSIDRQRVIIKCKVEDNSFYSYIANNRQIKVNLAANSTKGSQPITAIEFYDVDLYNSLTCIYGSTVGYTFKGYHAVDVLDFIVRAISDNKVTVQSTYLRSLTNQPIIFKGQSLGTSYTAFPGAPDPLIELSFEEVFVELTKIYNLAFYIDMTDPDNPVMLVEDYETTYNGQLQFTFEEIKELSTTATVLENYSTVRVGSDQTTSGISTVYPFPDSISYYGWRDEVYFPIGQCNTNNELDLKNRFVIDSNSIQDVLGQGGTGLLDSIFIIECDNVDTIALTATGSQFDPFNDGSCFYNIGLNNFNKLNRYQNRFENAFGNFFAGLNGTFRALLGSGVGATRRYQGVGTNTPNSLPYVGNSLFQLSVDSDYPNITTAGAFNNGSSYDNTTFRYTAPVDGIYTFEHRLFFDVYLGTQPGEYFRVTARMTHYDSANNVIAIQAAVPTVADINGQWQHSLSSIFTMVTGDYIKAAYFIEYQFWTNVQNPDVQNPRFLDVTFITFFEANGVPEGAGVLVSGTKVNNYIQEFTYNISQSDFLAIKANPTKRFNFTKDGVKKYGWIDTIKRNDWTGQTNIKLISDNAIIP